MGLPRYLLRHGDGETQFGRTRLLQVSDAELTPEVRRTAKEFSAACISLPWATVHRRTLYRGIDEERKRRYGNTGK